MEGTKGALIILSITCICGGTTNIKLTNLSQLPCSPPEDRSRDDLVLDLRELDPKPSPWMDRWAADEIIRASYLQIVFPRLFIH